MLLLTFTALHAHLCPLTLVPYIVNLKRLSKMIVTVAGANGNLAVRIIRLLLRKPDVLVRGYARNTAKIPEDIRNHSSFQPIQGQVRFTFCATAIPSC